MATRADNHRILPIVQMPARCEDCESPLEHPLICGHCHRVTAMPTGLSYFDLLEMPETYDLDESALTERYLDLVRRIHPDRNSIQSDARQRHLAQRVLVKINEAYRVLSDPIERGEYLLSRLGGEDMPADRRMPEGFWARVAEIERSSDGATRTVAGKLELEKLSSLRKEFFGQLYQLFGQFGEVLPGRTPLSANRHLIELLETLRTVLNALNYLSALSDRYHRSR